MRQVELIDVPPSREAYAGAAETWDVCAVTAGAGVWQYGRAFYPSRACSVRLKEPGEPFRTPRVDEPMGFQIIRLAPELFSRLLEPVAPRPHLRLAQTEDQRLFDLSCSIFARLCQTTTRLEADSLVQLLALEVLASALESSCVLAPSPEGAGVRRVREFIEASFAEEISLGTLAQIAGFHEVSLVRAFRRTYGLPPHAYQVQRRLLAARRSLSQGVPAAEVALAVGFFDQSHFYRHFKRAFGVTPGHFARAWFKINLPKTARGSKIDSNHSLSIYHPDHAVRRDRGRGAVL